MNLTKSPPIWADVLGTRYQYDTKEKLPAEVMTAKFLLTYRGWHTYAHDAETIEVICALVNLGIAQTNEHHQFALRSETRAKQLVESVTAAAK